MILLMFIVSHLLADFVFQFDEIIKLKFAEGKKDRLKGLILHTSIVALLNLSLLIFFPADSKVIVAIVAISLSHFLIDYTKASLKSGAKGNILYFFADQLCHFAVIYYFTKNLSNQARLVIDDKVLLYIICYIIATYVGSILVKLVLDYIYRGEVEYQQKLDALFPEDENSLLKEVKVGRVIGIIERFILFTLVLNSGFGAIGFIFAAKSLTRFKMLEKKVFAEYYLLGTLLSYTIVVFSYFLLKLLLEVGV